MQLLASNRLRLDVTKQSEQGQIVADLQETADRCISPCVVSRILPRLPAGQ
jgi:hypothetical protein